MLQAATFSLSAIGVLTATLALCAAMFVGWQRDLVRNNLVGLFIGVLMVLGLVVATGGNVNQSEGGLLRQSLTGLIYVLSFWFAIRARDGNLSIPWRLLPASLVLLVALAFTSSLWSAEPGITVRRAVQFAGVVIFAVAVVRNFDSQALWRQYVNALLPWLVLGLLVAPLASEFAFDTNGNFRGLSSHKNSWAGIALTATLLLATQLRQKPGSAWLWSAMLVSIFTLLLTRSATAVSLAAAILMLGLLYRAWLSRDNAMHAALIILVLICAAVPLLSVLITGESPLATASGLYFEAVQKEATLTGRNILWETVLNNAWLSPWLGSGYGAFWIGDSGPSVAVVAGLNWLPVHSHNGYIDLFNELGIAGVAIFAAMIISHLANIARIWRSNPNAAFQHLVIVIAVLGYNLSETSVLNATHALWVLLVVSVVDAHRLAGER